MTFAVRRMFYTAAVAASFAFISPLAPTSDAKAASRCGDRQTMVDYLADRFKETPRAMGMVSRKGVIELFVSDKGSWTMLVTMTSGKTCLMAAGESWEPIKAAALLDPAA